MGTPYSNLLEAWQQSLQSLFSLPRDIFFFISFFPPFLLIYLFIFCQKFLPRSQIDSGLQHLYWIKGPTASGWVFYIFLNLYFLKWLCCTFMPFPRKRCALKSGDEASVTSEMLHLSLTNLLVYWNHRLVGNVSMPDFVNGLFVQVGARCCKSCTIQPFRSCNNILLRALESREVPAIFILRCSSLRKRRAVCMWCLLGKHHSLNLLQIKLQWLIFTVQGMQRANTNTIQNQGS